ncbi:SDR family NAD(P)-dependent oxidoreductase [Thalassotalea euphylliae]|uniref:SDR family NAD(P)-dependent oxidoreductase n=1 Tax=Thalassotalea euphylliae TaxID=1655234 RepID=A0A3E0TXX1_9GAMM|nr:SDR family NAD(P)-dependent oxidoreductase [Thalassotalea euphylliae]REL29531.1 SDR family NAD(P)-dependent oxidoreductase [Thalassotalea euphylliae]
MRVLITGATSGIGEALVERYLEAGMSVLACGRSADKLKRLVSKHQEANDSNQLATLTFDITDSEQIQNATSTLVDIDIAILNAGDCEYIDDPFNFDAVLFERVIKVNLIAMGHLISALLPKISQGGQLALMSSSVTNLPFPRAQAYGASKAGLDYLAKAMQLELQPYQISVSLIHPGFIKTPLTDKNDFDMPFLMSSEQAAQRIFIGLSKRKNKIEFPKRFIYLMKIIACLPSFVWAGLNSKAITAKYAEHQKKPHSRSIKQ